MSAARVSASPAAVEPMARRPRVCVVYFFGSLGFSISARFHSASTIAETSLLPNPRARAALKASRVAATIGIGTFTALAASMIRVSAQDGWGKSDTHHATLGFLREVCGRGHVKLVGTLRPACMKTRKPRKSKPVHTSFRESQPHAVR